MSVNKDLNYVFTLTRHCLRILGVWPDPNASLSEFYWLNVRCILVSCSIIFYTSIPQITNVFRLWGNMTLVVECIASVNFGVLALSKLIVTWYYGKTLQTLMISIKTDWMTAKRKWERDTMLNIARTGRNLCFKCYASFLCATLFYLFFVSLKFYRSIHHSQRNLIYQFAYPYGMQKISIYAITYLIQFISAMYVAVINTTIDTFISLMLLHICGQLINLRFSLNECVENVTQNLISSKEFKKGVTAIVLRHQNLIKNAKVVNSCYSDILLLHIMVATFQLCLESFQVYTIITDENVKAPFVKLAFLTLYANMLLVNLYMFSYSSERLMTESTSIAYGIFECKWYALASKDAKDLMFIVNQSMIPLKLTAGKFNTFSIETFGMLVKTSMGYLSMLLAMKDKKQD